MKYKEVQEIAKKTIDYIKSEIKVGMSLIEVREKCENKMLDLGADSFWYYHGNAKRVFKPKPVHTIGQRNNCERDHIKAQTKISSVGSSGSFSPLISSQIS